MSEQQKPQSWPDDLEWPAGLAARLAWVAWKIGPIGKDGHVTQGGNFHYASVNAMAAAALTRLRQVGVALVPGKTTVHQMDQSAETAKGSKQWVCLLEQEWRAVSDFETSEPMVMGQDFSTFGFSLDTFDKAVNKAHRYAEKNALQMLLHIISDEDPESDVMNPQFADGPARAPRQTDKISAEQHKRMMAAGLGKWTDDQRKELLSLWGLESSKDVTLEHYDAIVEQGEQGVPVSRDRFIVHRGDGEVQHAASHGR